MLLPILRTADTADAGAIYEKVRAMVDVMLDMPATRPPVAAESRAMPPASIIPIWGLPIGIAIIGLEVVAIIGNWLWPLNFFHVVGGGLWTGIDLFVGLIIGPIIGRMSVQARVEFSARFMPKMMVVMPVLVTMTLASGFQLARKVGFLGASTQHPWLVASFIVVGVMSVIALGILEPANLAVLFELRKPEPNGMLIGKLMRRFTYTAGITGLMQVATLIIMTRLAI
jgi:uncharacterized membrane protein SirB2